MRSCNLVAEEDIDYILIEAPVHDLYVMRV